MSSSSPRRAAPGIALTLAASVIWGSSFVAIQLGLGSTGPLLLVALRFGLAALGALALAPALGLGGRLLGQLKNLRTWALGSLYAAGFALQFLGQASAGIANSTLLSNLFPALVPWVAGPLLGERLARRHGLAVLLSVLGLVAVTLPGFGAGPSTLVGDGSLVGSSAVYAVFIALSKRFRADSPESAFALVIVMAGTFVPVVALTAIARPSELLLSPGAWGSALYLAFPCTVVALALYLVGLRSVSASRSSMLLLLEPVSGLLLAGIWYRAAITPAVLVGAAMIVAAIAVACGPEPGGRVPEGRPAESTTLPDGA